MKVILFGIILSLYSLVSLYSSGKLSLTEQRKLIDFQYNLGEKLMGWNLSYANRSGVRVGTDSSRILVFANHLNYLDGYLISKYLRDVYPEHYIHPVVKSEVTKIPFLGSVFADNCICVERNYGRDRVTISDWVNYIKGEEEKSIILIFPEGTNRCPETHDASYDYCTRFGFPHFENVLSPRIKGVNLINELYQPETVLDLTIFYSDDPLNHKAQYVTDLLFNIIPKQAVIISSSMDGELTGEELYRRWYHKDKFLGEVF